MVCGDELVPVVNWSPGVLARGQRNCKVCRRLRTAKWRRDNPERDAELQARSKLRGLGQYVYVITNPAWPNHVKIGRTIGNPDKRLMSFNTGDPLRRYAFATLVEVDDAVEAERALHERFAMQRVDGEWFEMPLKNATRVAESLRKRSPSYVNS